MFGKLYVVTHAAKGWLPNIGVGFDSLRLFEKDDIIMIVDHCTSKTKLIKSVSKFGVGYVDQVAAMVEMT